VAGGPDYHLPEYHYLTLQQVYAIHAQVMRRLGASPEPLRDEGALESALFRPQQAAYYEEADLIRQAAMLAVGISQSQAFVDGDKRTAFESCDVFLRLHGHAFAGDPLDMAQRLEWIAERINGRDEATDAFEAWLRANVQ
jgi:death on curing protein